MLVLLASLMLMPCIAEMFELKNSTVDTGYYILPPDVDVYPETNTIMWSWPDGGATFVDLSYLPDDIINLPELSDHTAIAHLSALTAMFAITGRVITSENYALATENTVSLSTEKPYPGWLVTYPDTPLKAYGGVVDEHTYIGIASTESDEFFSLLLRGIRVISKENTASAKLEHIRAFANS